MDTPGSDDTDTQAPAEAPEPGTGPDAHVPPLPGWAVGYMIILFTAIGLPLGCARLMIDLTGSVPDIGIYFITAALFGGAVVAGALWQLLRTDRVPHPVASVCLLTAVVALAYVQPFVTTQVYWTEQPPYYPWFFSTLFGTLFGGMCAIVAVAATRRRRRFVVGAVLVAVMVVLRALVDATMYRDGLQENAEKYGPPEDAEASEEPEKSEWPRQSRASYEDVEAVVSDYPHEAVLLEADGWAPAHVRDSGVGVPEPSLTITYESADGERLTVTNWSDPDDALRATCGDGGTECEEFEEAGRTVVRFNDPEREGDLFVRTEWAPGNYVDVRPETSGPGFRSTELIALTGRLHPVGEGDTEALAEEVSGESRP